MKISIVTPTFNSEKTIERTIRSVQAQKYGKFEHIIVDNLSSDRTLEIARELYKNNPEKLNIISEKDEGISDAFNKGVTAADGDIVAILNSDDEYASDNIFRKVANKFESPEVMFVHGDMLFIDEEHGSNIRAPLLCSLTYAMPYNHPTMFLRKKLYDLIGIFKKDYRYAMDFELVCRMYQTPNTLKYKGYYLKEPMVNMYAGGASWKHELASIDDVERALRVHGFWDKEAEKNQNMRRLRIKAKNTMSKVGLNFLVKIWRNHKWKKSQDV